MILSIITINLNNKDGLQKTIDSVISQLFKDFEWIVIDGGSTDGSKELIEKYSSYFSYWVSEPDSGIYSAMNKGIRIAKGDYINFLNSGDYYVMNTTLCKVFNDRYSEEIIYGNSLYLTNPVTRFSGFARSTIYVHDFFRSNINHQAMFIKMTLFDRYGNYDDSMRLYADWKFNLVAIGINKCSVKYIPEDIVYYDINGISSTNKDLISFERQKIFKDTIPLGILEDYEFSLGVSEIRKYFISRLLYSCLYKLVLLYERLIGR